MLQQESPPEQPLEPSSAEENPENDKINAIKIVEKLKSVVSLPSFNPGHWTEAHSEAVSQFSQGSGRKILFIFYDSNELKVQTTVPYVYPAELCYLVADLTEGERITPANFNQRVHFGIVSGNILKSLLGQLETVFFPALYSYSGWHRSIRTDFLNQFQKFMANLTVSGIISHLL